MPATSALINGVAIALEIPLTPKFLSEVAYALNYLEQSSGTRIFESIQAIVDSINSVEAQITAYALSGQGLMIRADVIEWESGGPGNGLTNELGRLRLKLARSLGLECLLRSQNTIRILR